MPLDQKHQDYPSKKGRGARHAPDRSLVFTTLAVEAPCLGAALDKGGNNVRARSPIEARETNVLTNLGADVVNPTRKVLLHLGAIFVDVFDDTLAEL